MTKIDEYAQFVVKRVLEGKDPNEEIVKIAEVDTRLTDEHIKRIIETTNVLLFKNMFEKGAHEFPVADPKVIFEKLGRNKGMEKAAFSEEDFYVVPEEYDFFKPALEKSASKDELFVGNRVPRWQREEKLAEERPNEELIKLAALAKIRRLIEEGENYQIPKIEKIAHLLSRSDLLNLEFKKHAGFEESEELANEILRLTRYLE